MVENTLCDEKYPINTERNIFATELVPSTICVPEFDEIDDFRDEIIAFIFETKIVTKALISTTWAAVIGALYGVAVYLFLLWMSVTDYGIFGVSDHYLVFCENNDLITVPLEEIQLTLVVLGHLPFTKLGFP